jgi:hypothetical protein
MRLKLLIAGTAAAVFGVVAVPLVAFAVAGPTCTVGASGADYTTIQAAVNDTSCTTIKVAKGAYAENVTIPRRVIIKGAKAGNDADGRTFGASNESTVSGVSDTPAFTVNAADVTIDGFSVTNPGHGIGVTVKTAGDNAVIKNNIVDGLGSASYSQNTVGIYLELGPDNVRLSDNRINNVQSIPSAQGVLIGDSTSTNPSLDIRVVNNTISNITSVNKGAYGIQANNGAFTTVKILNNDIKNLNGHGWVHAIGLEGKTPNVVVKQNVVSNLTTSGANKVAVWFEDNIFFFTADVNRNNLNVGATGAGIAVHPSLVSAYPSLNVDGTCNYWGAANGPSSLGIGSGSHVGPGVDYSPWLKGANLNGKCSDQNKNDWDSHDGDNNNYNHLHQYDD